MMDNLVRIYWTNRSGKTGWGSPMDREKAERFCKAMNIVRPDIKHILVRDLTEGEKIGAIDNNEFEAKFKRV